MGTEKYFYRFVGAPFIWTGMIVSARTVSSGCDWNAIFAKSILFKSIERNVRLYIVL